MANLTISAVDANKPALSNERPGFSTRAFMLSKRNATAVPPWFAYLGRVIGMGSYGSKSAGVYPWPATVYGPL